MNKLTMNNDNKRYYSDEYIRGWENGVQAQYKADIESMPKGEWIDRTTYESISHEWECSECGEYTIIHYDFCPYCGAKMGGDTK